MSHAALARRFHSALVLLEHEAFFTKGLRLAHHGVDVVHHEDDPHGDGRRGGIDHSRDPPANDQRRHGAREREDDVPKLVTKDVGELADDVIELRRHACRVENVETASVPMIETVLAEITGHDPKQHADGERSTSCRDRRGRW